MPWGWKIGPALCLGGANRFVAREMETAPVVQIVKNGARMNSYEAYAITLDALRNLCRHYGLIEFMPPTSVPGFAHYPHMHATLMLGEEQTILPYQLSLHNRLATHHLDRPSFCVGPCFRNDERSPLHSRSFTQFTFELFSTELDELAEFSLSLFQAVLRTRSIELDVVTIDMLHKSGMSDAMIKAQATEMNQASLVKHKRKGVPPLLNATVDEQHEQAIELILPRVGETLDGGVRDPAVLQSIYGLTPERETAGATFGLDRLVAYVSGASDLRSLRLP